MGEDRKRHLLLLLPVVVLVAVVALYYGWRRMSRAPELAPAAAPADTPAEPPGADLPPGSAFGPLEQEWVEITGGPPEWPDDFGQPTDCAAALDRLRALADRVDQGDYAKASGVREGTFELLLDVADALDRRKPSIGGRLDDGDAMRANVVHFVLALGPERTARLVRLMRRQSRLAEPFALALYQWLSAGKRCPADLRPPSADVQYEYAAFLLRTIGGQAYLRRRTPRIETLTSFYALRIADAAAARGHNPHGLDLRPEIARCKALMEMQPVVFRSQYLRALEDLETRWASPETVGR